MAGKTWSTQDLLARAEAGQSSKSSPSGGGATGSAPGLVGGLINLAPTALPQSLILSFGAPSVMATTLTIPVA